MNNEVKHLICIAKTDKLVDVVIPSKVQFVLESYYPGNEKLCDPIYLLYSMIVGLKNLAKRGEYFHRVSTILRRHGTSISINPSANYDIAPCQEHFPNQIEYSLEHLLKDEKELLQFLFSDKYHLFWR